MARIIKAEKYRRVEQIRQILACGGTRADCLAVAAGPASNDGIRHPDQSDGRCHSCRGTGDEAGSVGPLRSVIFFHPTPPREKQAKHQSDDSEITAKTSPRMG